LGITASQSEEKRRLSKRHLAFIVVVVLIISAVAGFLVFYRIPPITGDGPVNIEVVSDKPFFLQGEDVFLLVYVYNLQNWSVPYHSKIRYGIEGDNITGGQDIDYAPDSNPVFSPHSRTLIFKYSWNRLAGGRMLVPGNHTFRISIEGPVDYGEGGSYTFEVKPNPNLVNGTLPSPACSPSAKEKT